MKRIFAMKRIAVVGPMSQELQDIMGDNLGHDVANVYMSLLAFPENAEKRLMAAAGQRLIFKYEEFLKKLIRSDSNLAGLREAYDLTVRALDSYESQAPKTYEEMMRIPMNPEVKDVRASKKGTEYNF
jgi:hypothetical protein